MTITKRIRIDAKGAVQGVGFRPFVHRLAAGEGLGGFVRNTESGVSLEVEGPDDAVSRFLERFGKELSLPAVIEKKTVRALTPKGESNFRILPSRAAGQIAASVPADLAVCPECAGELFDPKNRRYRYSFITCAHCGPRYSIIEVMPYDRARTAMRHFVPCPDCAAEYDDPASRRFHAETISCKACGPRLTLLDSKGTVMAGDDEALMAAVEAIAGGRIVACKALGGFQLLADARNDGTIQTLRARKRRPSKPFAVMAGSLQDARRIANITDREATLLESPAAPIVLSWARKESPLAPSVAPGNPLLGLMLPSTPLHHLLLRALGFPIVATSGNASDEPLAASTDEALARLSGIADFFLVHDRPILRPVDDSVVRIMAGQETVLRLARSYAPLALPFSAGDTQTLALGGHQKAAIAVAFKGQLVLGPHIGDLGSPEARRAYRKAAEGMTALHGLSPALAAHDAHPGYHSTHAATSLALPAVPVPHHLAHILAGMLDNDLPGPVLGVAWDGTGFGGDGTVWGGEFMTVKADRCRRAAHLLPFPLPGGEAAVREPRRAALGVLYALYGADAFGMMELAPQERTLFASMLSTGTNTPLTSSAGRLFDAVSWLLGLCQAPSFEGEAAMAVEFAAARAEEGAAPDFAPVPSLPAAAMEESRVDWRPPLKALLDARNKGVSADALAAAFHAMLADAIVAVASGTGMKDVVLTGGCFQNARLSELAAQGLRDAGFRPHLHRRIPPNDGGLAAGQAVFAARPLIWETV